MNVPMEQRKCAICIYSNSFNQERCVFCDNVEKNHFELDDNKICKWCYNPVAPGDNICAEHRKSHEKHSWRGQLESAVEDQKKQLAAHEIAEKKARRERIASSLLAAIYSNRAYAGMEMKTAIHNVIDCANALIAALDEVKE